MKMTAIIALVMVLTAAAAGCASTPQSSITTPASGQILAATTVPGTTNVKESPVNAPITIGPSGIAQLPFEAGLSIANKQENFLPGEEVMYGISIRNLSSGIIVIDPFPPVEWIKSLERNEIVYSEPAGQRTQEIVGTGNPASWYHTKGSWYQRDNNGQQVADGWYEMGYEYTIIEKSTGKKYTAVPTAKFQVVNPNSAMNKNLDVNKTVTTEGVSVTLKRIEINAVETKVYIFTTPPGYSLPTNPSPSQIESHMANSLMTNSIAEYGVDGGTIKQVKSDLSQADAEGITLIWDELDPIQVDAKEFNFSITQFGDTKGRWEFKISLTE